MTEAERNLHPGDLSTTNVASYDSKLLLWMNNNVIPTGRMRVRDCTVMHMCVVKHHWLVAADWACDQGPLMTVRGSQQTWRFAMMDGYPSGVVRGAGEYTRGERQEYTLEDSLVLCRAYTKRASLWTVWANSPVEQEEHTSTLVQLAPPLHPSSLFLYIKRCKTFLLRVRGNYELKFAPQL